MDESAPMDQQIEPLMSKADVARHFDVHPKTVEVWLRRGLIPAPIKVAGTKGRARWDRAALMKHVTKGE
jgi:transposase-like protein